jgi:mannose-6-phosphate isomerase-like protein (cupin superfamily)
MRIIHKEQTREFKNSENCVATEYLLEDKEIDTSIVKLKGRYPNKGRVVNLICKELIYISEGSGKIEVENEEINIKEGDLILIEHGEKYFWDGNLTLIISCTPAWYPEQHKEVE